MYQINDEFSEGITEIAQLINDKGQESDWEYDEIQELFDKLENISKKLLPVVKRNDFYYDDSILYKLLYWITKECNRWIEEVDEIDGLSIDFTDEEMDLVGEIIPSDDIDSPAEEDSELAEIRARISRRSRKRRKDAEAAL